MQDIWTQRTRLLNEDRRPKSRVILDVMYVNHMEYGCPMRPFREGPLVGIENRRFKTQTVYSVRFYTMTEVN